MMLSSVVAIWLSSWVIVGRRGVSGFGCWQVGWILEVCSLWRRVFICRMECGVKVMLIRGGIFLVGSGLLDMCELGVEVIGISAVGESCGGSWSMGIEGGCGVGCGGLQYGNRGVVLVWVFFGN